MIDIEIFNPIINSLAVDLNAVIDKDDLKQEFRLKLLSCMPYLESVDEDGIFKVAKTILSHHKIDLIAYSSNRPDMSHFSSTCSVKDGEEIDMIDSMASDEVYDIHDILKSSRILNNEEDITAMQMKENILDWAQQQGGIALEYITNALRPSASILERWEEMKLGYARYRHYEHIPPLTLIKMLGHKDGDYWYKVLEPLKIHLNDLGYEIS